MAIYCPIIKKKTIYLDCLECEDKICKNKQQNKSDKKENINKEAKEQSYDRQ